MVVSVLMDCSLCTSMPLNLRPPRNFICAQCFDGAQNLATLINKFDGDKRFNDDNEITEKYEGSPHYITHHFPSSFKGFPYMIKWVKEMKEKEEELNDQLKFLGDFGVAFKKQMHFDILVKPGQNGPPIPAHRALLAARSEIFKNMLDSDGCKDAPTEAITLPELSHSELKALLEFLYQGSLPIERVEKHVYSLCLAADKYMIPYLHKVCENHMLISLSKSNALDILQISDCSSLTTLKDTALKFIVKNMEGILFTPKFETFALKNAHLSVLITRALFTDLTVSGNVKVK